jgi:hypothetical protein
MSADVISHQAPRRKHAHAWSWTTRRIGVLVVTVAALVAASWLAPEINSPAPPALASRQQTVQPIPPPALPERATADISADVAMPQARRTARAAARRTSVPLDGSASHAPAGYEILSAAELDGISQARE